MDEQQVARWVSGGEEAENAEAVDTTPALAFPTDVGHGSGEETEEEAEGCEGATPVEVDASAKVGTEPTATTSGAAAEAGRVKRHRFTPEQMEALKTAFVVNPSPSSQTLRALAEAVGVPLGSCRLWFKNRRARWLGKPSEGVSRDAAPETNSEAMAPESMEETRIPGHPEAVASTVTDDNAARHASLRLSALGVAGASVQEHQHPAPDSSNDDARATTNHTDSDVPRSIAVEATVPAPDTHPDLMQLPLTGPPPILRSPHRSPRTRVPPTPRLQSHRAYRVGEPVELLDASGPVRAWHAARVVRCNVPLQSPTDSLLSAVEIAREDGIDRVSEFDGIPATIRTAYEIELLTPAPSYNTGVPHEGHGEMEMSQRPTTPVRRVALGVRLRPAPPLAPRDWRPDIGEAVEALVMPSAIAATSAARVAAVRYSPRLTTHAQQPSASDSTAARWPAHRSGCWIAGQVRDYLARKGYLIAFADMEEQWLRLDALRPYATWRGGDQWQVKSKAPVAVSRRAVTAAGAAHPSPHEELEEAFYSQRHGRSIVAAQQLALRDAQVAAARERQRQEDMDEALERLRQQRHEWVRQPWQAPAHPILKSLQAGRGRRPPPAPSRRPRTESDGGRRAATHSTTGAGADRRPAAPLVIPGGKVVAGADGLVVGAGAADRRHKGGRKPTMTLTLPAGWRLEEQIRRGGSLAGRIDRVYVSPDGRRFRSLKELAKFLERVGPIDSAPAATMSEE